MSRLAFAVALVAALPSISSAQISPTMGPISPVMGPISPVPQPLRPGFPGRPGFPFPPFPGFPGGGFFPYYGYGYGYNYPPPPTVVVVPVQVPAGPPAPPERVVIPGNEFPAVLVLEFPAPAEVWVNGEKSDAKPDREWTLTSPVLKQGEEFTFKVKARWKTGDKTYETERSITVPNGKRSRALVVGGTEVKE